MNVGPVRPDPRVHGQAGHLVDPDYVVLGCAVDRPRPLTVRVGRTAQESAKAIPPDLHRLAARVARFPLGGQNLLDDFLGPGLAVFELALEGRIELGQEGPPPDFALLHPIQFTLHPTGERYVEDVRKNPDEQL